MYRATQTAGKFESRRHPEHATKRTYVHAPARARARGCVLSKDSSKLTRPVDGCAAGRFRGASGTPGAGRVRGGGAAERRRGEVGAAALVMVGGVA